MSTETAPERAKNPRETERKFHILELPAALQADIAAIMDGTGEPKYSFDIIHQGYLAVGADGSEVRVRDCSGAYTLTVKSDGTLDRDEFETPLVASQFDKLWPATEGKRVHKMRIGIPHDELLIELDIYTDELTGLMVAEV